MIKTDADYKANQLHEQAMLWTKDLCLNETQDELFKLAKRKVVN